jgi:hypothetical protein
MMGANVHELRCVLAISRLYAKRGREKGITNSKFILGRAEGCLSAAVDGTTQLQCGKSSMLRESHTTVLQVISASALNQDFEGIQHLPEQSELRM